MLPTRTMNLWIAITLFLISAMCTFSDPVAQKELPANLEVGAYIFGCRINGEIFVTRYTTEVVATYQGGILCISGSSEDERKNFGFCLTSANVTVGTYKFDKSFFPDRKANYTTYPYGRPICLYTSQDDGNTAELTISKFDAGRQIVSGYFVMHLKAAECDAVEITEGRFDVIFTW